jgi:hypothetical protein
MKKILTNITLIIIVAIPLFQGCSSDNESTSDTKAVTTTNIEAPKRIKMFNDVNQLVNTLSQNGIGDLKQWENPMDVGYGSITNYFQIGQPLDQYGLANNIAYYLKGTETSAESLLINLNINNPTEKRYALNFLSNLTHKTFKSIHLKEPVGLIKAIRLGKKFEGDDTNYSTSFKLDKSKIETWKVTILSK